MASVVNSFSLAGIDAYTVKIETDTIYGQPSINIVGLGDTTVKEAKEWISFRFRYGYRDFNTVKTNNCE